MEIPKKVKRRDIEVFFRFIKQELNFSHFMPVNENGIQNSQKAVRHGTR
jgi:hypothetical protein